jgi:hypothetical protein
MQRLTLMHVKDAHPVLVDPAMLEQRHSSFAG